MFFRRTLYARYIFCFVLLFSTVNLMAAGNLDIKWMRFYNAFNSQKDDDVLTATLELLYPNDALKQKTYASYLENRSSSESVTWAEGQVSLKNLPEKDKVVPTIILLMDSATSSSLTTPSLSLTDIFPNHKLSGQISYSNIADAIIVRNSTLGRQVRALRLDKTNPNNDYPSTYSVMAQTYKVPENQLEEVKASIKANLYGTRYSTEDKKTLRLRCYSYFNTVDDKELFEEMLSLLEKADSGQILNNEHIPLFEVVMRIGTLSGSDYFEPVFKYVDSQTFQPWMRDDSMYSVKTKVMLSFLQVHSEKPEVAKFLFDRLVYEQPGRFYRSLESIAFTIRQNIRAKVQSYSNSDILLRPAVIRYENILSLIRDK